MIQKLENGETKTGKQARNTFILPISDSSPTSPAVTPKHSTHHIVHNSPIPSYNPFGSPTPLNQPKSEPVPNYNPFGSPIASNPEQAASSSTSFPLSPLGTRFNRI